MSELQASFLEIEPHELVHCLLRETGQKEVEKINSAQILNYLKLDYEIIKLKDMLSEDLPLMKKAPRAVLSFPDKLIVLDHNLPQNRQRFSVLHEIAHYVLPTHQNEFYICEDKDLNSFTQCSFEKEANDFAADLLFLGDRFTLESNSKEICALTVKQLAGKYKASFEATARRLVEKTLRPCMLIVFQIKQNECAIDSSLEQRWEVFYCIASKVFKTKYFREVSGTLPPDITLQLTEQNRDISDSIRRPITIKDINFQIEYFYNQYNIFAFLLPEK